MPLSISSRLGRYEIVARIGAGGMGEVYRAKDSKLGRDVAIKVLPEAFTEDSERMARFEREAKVLAALSHPNIAAIYGVEDSGSADALVMELAEGPTLADRIHQGPIPLEEALPIARQIADALEYAHEHGVVHRDLKPANVKVTPDDSVKILDFGLAKAVQVELSPSNVADSPTMTQPATQPGLLLGTAAYMSPEQARGKQVDRRADIWAFGCVVYEMVTGRRAFQGEAAAEILAAVLRAEPDWSQLPPATPAHIRVLLQRCLQKDPKQRLRDIGDARIAIEEILSGSPSSSGSLAQVGEADKTGQQETSPRRGALPWLLAAVFLLLSVVLVLVHFRQHSAPAPATRSQIAAPEKMPFAFEVPDGAPALSSDGTRLVFPAYDDSGNETLWVRPLDSLTAQRLPGTDDARFPFWAPDSRQIGFFQNGKLSKIDVTGGPPVAICDAANGRGGTWNRNGLILFAPQQLGGLYSVSASGGAPAPISTPNAATDGKSERWPQFLPDGKHYLYLGGDLGGPGTAKLGIYIGALGSKDASFLLQADSDALYAAPGYLLFLRGDTLMAQRFDAASLKLEGNILPVAEHIPSPRTYRLGIFAVSQTGLLVYSTGEAGSGGYGRLVWVDAEGKEIGKVGSADAAYPHLSPNGKMLAYVSAPPAMPSNIWLMDLARGAETRLTFGPGSSTFPVWSPDGSRIAYSSGAFMPTNIFIKDASGAGNAELLVKADDLRLGPDVNVAPTDWSSDGRYILFASAINNGTANRDIWVLPLFGDRKPFPYLQTRFDEGRAVFSPDGHWVAYVSNESGKLELYVSTFPAGGGKWQVSQDGGVQPEWGRDGKELYFEAPSGGVMEAKVTEKGRAVEIGMPHQLFKVSAASLGGSGFAVAPDGKRFLMVEAELAASQPLTLVTNWTTGLEK